jgi:hypothetical protein
MLEYSNTTTATRDRLMNSRLGIATLLVLKQQVLDYAAQLDRQFGAIFEPPR